MKKVLQIQEYTLIESGKSHQLTENERTSLQFHIDVQHITDCKKYQKMIYKHCRYTDCFYSRNKKRNDSVFQSTNDKYGVITSLYLIKHNNNTDVFIFYKLLKLQSASIISDENVLNLLNLNECSIESNNAYCINYSMLHRPCIIYKLDKQYYLSSVVKGVMGRCIN